jgi:tRNA pseudouridine38-40 synthase
VRSIRLQVAYDGTEFHGWQSQPGLRSVQGVLEAHLAKVVGEPIRTVAAGRTDAGVHARGQVVSFATSSALPARAIAAQLLRRLPPDLRVRTAEEAPERFDARRDARARRYSYRLLAEDDVLLGRFAWRPRLRFDCERLERATRCLEGEHECSAFRARGGSAATPWCRITRASWRRWEGGVMLDIVADHFLYRMVRNVVGTALQAMRAPDPRAAMAAVLASRDRGHGGVTAPPQGLCLEEVFYAGPAGAPRRERA